MSGHHCGSRIDCTSILRFSPFFEPFAPFCTHLPRWAYTRRDAKNYAANATHRERGRLRDRRVGHGLHGKNHNKPISMKHCQDHLKNLKGCTKPARKCPHATVDSPTSAQELCDHKKGWCYERWLARAARRARRAGVEDPEACAQDALIGVAARWDENRGPFGPYFNRAVRWRIASALRQQRRQPPADTLDDHFHSPAKHGGVSQELRQAVSEAAGQLSPLNLELLQQAAIDDRSHAEIARDAGLTVSTVKNRLSRACKKLRRLLHKIKPQT